MSCSLQRGQLYFHLVVGGFKSGHHLVRCVCSLLSIVALAIGFEALSFNSLGFNALGFEESDGRDPYKPFAAAGRK